MGRGDLKRGEGGEGVPHSREKKGGGCCQPAGSCDGNGGDIFVTVGGAEYSNSGNQVGLKGEGERHDQFTHCKKKGG